MAINKDLKKSIQDALEQGKTDTNTVLCLARMIEHGDTEVLAHLCRQYGSIVSKEDRDKIVKTLNEVACSYNHVKFTRGTSHAQERELIIGRYENVIPFRKRS